MFRLIADVQSFRISLKDKFSFQNSLQNYPSRDLQNLICSSQGLYHQRPYPRHYPPDTIQQSKQPCTKCSGKGRSYPTMVPAQQKYVKSR